MSDIAAEASSAPECKKPEGNPAQIFGEAVWSFSLLHNLHHRLFWQSALSCGIHAAVKHAKLSPTRGRVGPYYKVGKLALLDGRRAEAQFIRKEQAKLIAAIGGEAMPTPQVLIERADATRPG